MEKNEENCECCCGEEVVSAEDMIRDIINFIHVKKNEELPGATHMIEAQTAEELTSMLEDLAIALGEVCSCD